MRGNASLKRIIELKIGVGLMLGIALVGYVAIAAEQRAAPQPAMEERASSEAKSKQDGLIQELATLPTGVEVQLEEAYPEIYRAVLAQHAPAAGSPVRSVRVVETTGGNLSILEQGDGVIHLLAVAFNQRGPDFQNANFGLAFSAVITKDGIEVTSVDKEGLARFVGQGREGISAVGGDGADGGVAAAPNPVTQDVVVTDCKAVFDVTCCIVATDTKFCRCCASSETAKCICTDLR